MLSHGSKIFKNYVYRAFLIGSVVKNLAANTEDMGSIPDPGRSHMPQNNLAWAPQLLSLCSSAWEPQLLKARSPRACALKQKKQLQWGARESQLDSSPRSLKLKEKPKKKKRKERKTSRSDEDRVKNK